MAGCDPSILKKATIIGFNHNKDLETNGKFSITLLCFDLRDFLIFEGNTELSNYCVIYNIITRQMNTTASNIGGWESSNIRTECAEISSQEYSLDWQQNIGSIIKYTDNVGLDEKFRTQQLSDITATQDKCFLLSEYEVMGQHYFANQYEQQFQQQYEIFKNGKVMTGGAIWLRSPIYDTLDGTVGEEPYFGVAISQEYNDEVRIVVGGLSPNNQSSVPWAFCIVAE